MTPDREEGLRARASAALISNSLVPFGPQDVQDCLDVIDELRRTPKATPEGSLFYPFLRDGDSKSEKSDQIKVLKTISKHVCDNELREALTYIHVGDGYIDATSGHRFIRYKMDYKMDEDFPYLKDGNYRLLIGGTDQDEDGFILTDTQCILYAFPRFQEKAYPKFDKFFNGTVRESLAMTTIHGWERYCLSHLGKLGITINFNFFDDFPKGVDAWKISVEKGEIKKVVIFEGGPWTIGIMPMRPKEEIDARDKEDEEAVDRVLDGRVP